MADLFAGPKIFEILLQVNFCGPFWQAQDLNPGQKASNPGQSTLSKRLRKKIRDKWRPGRDPGH